MITQEELKQVRDNLPTNYLATLHEKLALKWSKSLIEKVLRGDRNNDDIIMAAIELAEETRSKKIALKERINTL